MVHRPKSKVGQTLGRSYRIERLLGVGGVGAVYVGRHLRTGALCAIKVLHRNLGPSGEAYQRFVEETRTIGLLRHPHILPFSDFDHDDGGALYLVMDLLEGENLQQKLQHKGCLPLSQVLEFARQAGGALHAAHRSGILHRNLRPENVFLSRQDLGDHFTETARVMDFGLGRLRRGAALDKEDGEGARLLGLSQYTAPEVALDPAAPMDARADQWSLAVLLYRALAGRLPFEGESLREVLRCMTEEEPLPLPQAAPELPEHVAGAVARGLRRDPKERHDSVIDLVRALSDRPSRGSGSLAVSSALALPAPASAQSPIPAGQQVASAPAGPPARGRTSLIGAGALVLALAGGATLWFLDRRPSPGLALSPGAPRQEAPAGPAQAKPTSVPAPLGALDPPPLPEPAPPSEKAPPIERAPPIEKPHAARAPRLPVALSPPRLDPEEEPPDGEGSAGKSAAALLAEAQAAYTDGDKQGAIALALSATARGGNALGAWRFLGSAACQVRDSKLASRAYRHLNAEGRQFVSGVCQRQGLDLVDGEFRAEPWP